MMRMTMMVGDEPPMDAGTVLLETVVSDPAGHDGTLSGDNALGLMGKAALAAARRRGNGRVTMVRTDDVRFYHPIPAGHLLELTARIIHASTSRANATRMTVLVDGMAQPAAGGRRTLVLSGYFQMLAAGDEFGG